MKRLISTVLIILLIASLAACSSQPSTAGPETTALPQDTSVEPGVTTVDEAKAFAPMDMFGSELNPFYDADFPETFNIYAASFSRGSAKLEGKAPYTLSMTASGNTDEAIAFLASLAGLSDEERDNRTDEYTGNGFSEFLGKDGVTYTIRRTNPDDDRYEFVEGCHIDIWLNLTESDTLPFIQLIRDNFNVNALAGAADYFDIVPSFGECGIGVNLHKKEVRTDMLYLVEDVATLQKSLSENLQSNWYDAQSGKMGLSYGKLELEILFDNKGGGIYVTEHTNDLKTALSTYLEPEVSLAKLGFQFSEEDALCLFEIHNPHYMNVAIHKPEWGNRDENWNVEYLDEINGYGLRITVNYDENRYNIMLQKGEETAMFDYLPATKTYSGEYPDNDTVKQMFNDAFGTQGDGFYEKPIPYFEQLIEARFGLTTTALYALPIK